MFLEEYFGLKGKVALVTGGSRGIGQRVALDLSQAGAGIAIFTINGAEQTVKMIEEKGGRAKSFIVDVCDENSVNKGMKELTDEFGSLDIVFNNAGITIHKSVMEATIEDWNRILNTNLIGEVNIAKDAARIMIERKIQGSIINMASMSGSVVNIPQRQTLYNVSKAAVKHLTKCLAIEWAEYGIRVNSVSPGYTMTEMSVVSKEMNDAWLNLIPVKRMGQPSEISGVVLMLASGHTGYVNGADILIDGAYSCF